MAFFLDHHGTTKKIIYLSDVRGDQTYLQTRNYVHGLILDNDLTTARIPRELVLILLVRLP